MQPSARTNRATVLEAGLDLANFTDDRGTCHLLLGRINHNVRLVGIIEEGEHLVIFFLSQGVVLVAVALGALDRQAENSLADAVHPVKHGLHAELLGVDPSFLIDHRVPQKPGRDDLVLVAPGSWSPAICSMTNWL